MAPRVESRVGMEPVGTQFVRIQNRLDLFRIRSSDAQDGLQASVSVLWKMFCDGIEQLRSDGPFIPSELLSALHLAPLVLSDLDEVISQRFHVMMQVSQRYRSASYRSLQPEEVCCRHFGCSLPLHFLSKKSLCFLTKEKEKSYVRFVASM